MPMPSELAVESEEDTSYFHIISLNYGKYQTPS
jgi:hypothetical protein